jgi:hypothetical protein
MICSLALRKVRHRYAWRSRSPNAWRSGDVRFGSLADIVTSPRRVRFHTNSGRRVLDPGRSLFRRGLPAAECGGRS